MSSKMGAQLNWGTVGGGKREWGGGGQFTSNLGPGWTRIAPHRKEGFQVSKTDSATKGLSWGVVKRSYQGELSRGCAMCLVLSTCTYVSCYCVNVANKRIVFRLEINHVCEEQDTCI
jgi:hypothetical protein